MGVKEQVEVTSLQLAGCNTDCGRLEVKLNGGPNWFAVCADRWSMKEARVICAQLGFRETLAAPTNYKVGDTEVEKLNISCDGHEKEINECKISILSGKCPGEGVVGATCTTTTSVQSEQERRESNEILKSISEASDLVNQKTIEKWNLDKNMDIDDCDFLPGVPFPFSQELVKEAFVYHEDIYPIYHEMDRNLRLNLCNPQDNSGVKIQRVLKEIVEAGLKWNVLGMDLSAVLKNESSSITRDHFDLLHQLYFKFNEHDILHWGIDFYHQLDKNPSSEKGEGIERLNNHGFLKVENFGLDPSVLNDLIEISNDVFEGAETVYNAEHNAWVSVTSNGTVSTARLLLPQLESFITNKDFKKIITNYMGDRVKLDGYKLTRLNPAATANMETSYVASRWHHDRTGRRIKLFIFLHDIDCEQGHPTKVAIGTQNLVYYRTETLPSSRFTDKFVNENYQIVEGCGKKGGGFLFDTHTIHRGTPEGSDSRTTLIMEYHRSDKCPIARELGLGLPCPSGDQFIINREL